MGMKLIITGLVFGIIFTLTGIIGLFFADKLIHSMVTSSMKLTPDSELYKQWLTPPIEVHMNLYLFNLKNGEDFEKNGAKPVFEEIGPFVYKEVISKEEIVDNLNYTITYKERRQYFFIPELSPYEESYPITTLNMAPIAIISQIKYTPGVVHSLVNTALRLTGETLLVTKPASQILFGYEDEFLKILSTLDKKLVPSDIVGLFINKNNTIDGLYTIYTGVDDYKNTGNVQRFNYQSEMNIWTTKYANMINGTDGSFAQPFLTKDTVIYIFESDLCRSLYANFNGTMTLLDDILVYGFSPNEYFFANSSVNPDNGGFCVPAGDCLPAGALNLTTCVGGIPIIMTCPHFLFCDEKYIKDVDGIEPNLEEHKTNVWIEPTTGILMKANKRIQFNTQLFRDPRIDITKKLPEILFPLFWCDENLEIDKPNADKFASQVRLPLRIITVGKYCMLGIGLILFVVSLVFRMRSSRKTSSGRYLSINTHEHSNHIDENSPLVDS